MVDKTEGIFRLVNEGMFYFLARPRRFGKSLLVSTLQCLFQGKRELFEGLWVEQQAEWPWNPHPVVLIDFNGISCESPEELQISLKDKLSEIAEAYGVSLKSSLLKDRFRQLILTLSQKTGMPVVILVDEYDKPIIDHLGKGGAGLNDNFTDHLEALREEFNWTWEQLRQQLAARYNGYRFTSKAVSVYNPFSILNIFRDLELKDYWFESGSPSFLVNLIYERQFDLPQLEALQLEAKQFSTYNLENLNLTALLFQTGYLTIKDYDGTYYTLSYPNQEVHTGFIDSLWETYSGLPNSTPPYRLLASTLENEQFEDFFQTLESTISEIPYTLGANQKDRKTEPNYYHTIFFLLLSSTGILARNEVLTSHGRIDMVVEFSDKVFIFEFKCNQSASAAIQQIQTKGYATPYQKTGKPITLVGVDFNTELRNIAEWKVEPWP